jgi:allantoin racemase
MAKIKVIVPIKGLTDEEIESRHKVLASKARPGTTMKFVVVEEGPQVIESHFQECQAVMGILKEVGKMANEDYDAAIIWCALDPALEAAREISSFPIIGPGEASMLLASYVGHKFTVVVPSVDNVYINNLATVAIENMAKKLGVRENLVAVRPIQSAVLDLTKNKEQNIQTVIELTKVSLREDKTQAIALACLGMTGFAEEIQKRVGIPIIDPGVAALKMAETLVEMGLSFSRFGLI